MKQEMAAFLAGLKQKIAPLVTPEPRPKMSQTRRKKAIRAWKTRPRASCDSFRYRQQHQAELRLERRAQQSARWHAKPKAAVQP